MGIPSIEIESANGIRTVSLDTYHLSQRRLFISGEINEDLANTFMAELMYLEQVDSPVWIYVNSPGGKVIPGLMIYDLIQNSHLQINMVCSGEAASMAALLIAGGQKGRRYILPHSKMMIHEPLMRQGVGGSATGIQSLAESILQTRELTNGLLAKHTGKTLKQINKATSFDNYFSAEQAVKFGLVDQVVTDSRTLKGGG